MCVCVSVCVCLCVCVGVGVGGMDALTSTIQHLYMQCTLCDLPYRQLSGVQSIWFKKSPMFLWLNLAPGGQRLPLDSLVKAVAEWFTNDIPLPRDWDGKTLQNIVRSLIVLFRGYDVFLTASVHISPSLVSTNQCHSFSDMFLCRQKRSRGC